MKTGVIFYSFEGNTKFVSEKIAEKLNADLLEIKTAKDNMPKNFMKFIWGGSQVVMNKKPEIITPNVNFQDYDVLFIGTPVWASSVVPAITSFLEKNKFQNKKFVLFSCYDGNSGKTFEMIKNFLENNQIISQMGFLSPLKNKEDTIKNIDIWLDSLKGKI